MSDRSNCVSSNASNTIHVDDLGRNFALNPNEGLKIGAFKDAFTAQAAEDRELDKLARYMVHIAQVPDLRTVNHKVRLPLCSSRLALACNRTEKRRY